MFPDGKYKGLQYRYIGNSKDGNKVWVEFKYIHYDFKTKRWRNYHGEFVALSHDRVKI